MFISNIFTTRKWAGKWIWQAGAGNEKNVYYYFRKVLDSDQSAKADKLCITADTRYQLFINGRFVGRGTPQSQPYLQYYDVHDISDALASGRNCIAVIVNYIGNIPSTRGGLLAEITDSKGGPVAATDSSWKTLRSRAWQQDTYYYGPNKATPYQEFFDARAVPENWTDVDFDDRFWQTPEIIQSGISDRPPCAAPWIKIIERDIPRMTADPVLAHRIECVEESLDLENRPSSNNLAPILSQAGKPIEYSRVDNPENLCKSDGITIVQNSLNHLDLDFDGIYAPAIVLDFGRVITARVRLELTGPAGGMVDIGYAERLINGYFNNNIEGSFADRCIMKEGGQTFESFTWKSFRYLKLRFRNCYEPVTLKSVQGIITTYPYEEQGGFSSGDTTLNKVFDISKATVRLCSNEFLMDTPWREQAQWLGDIALVTVPAIYSCFGDTRITRKFFLQSGHNLQPTGLLSNVSNITNPGWQNQIPDYSLWWLQGLREHYLYTGDADLLHYLYPAVLRILQAHLERINPDGLLEDMPHWIFIDWADTDRRGICTAYNAIFYNALKSVKTLAGVKNDTHTLNVVDQAMAGIERSFHKTLFDPKRSCYPDAKADGVFSDKLSEHANMAPVYAGLCDSRTEAKVIHEVFESDSGKRFTEAQPFFMTVVLTALDRAGRMDLALDLIHRRWGKRMVERGVTSVYEEWYNNGSWRSGEFKGFMRTHSHAWSACPADFLIRRLPGVEILEPGCKKIRLTPRTTDFDYDITWPTPLGPVRVQCSDGNVNTSVPDGVQCE